MKKQTIIVLGLTIILLLTICYPAIGREEQQNKKQYNSELIELTYHFSDPTLLEKNEYTNIHLPEANVFLRINGNPIIPYYTETIELPFRTKIKNIEVINSEIKEISLKNKINPAPKPISFYEKHQYEKTNQNNDVYLNTNSYPDTWYSYRTGGGLNRNNEHTTFLTIQTYPIRYIPLEDKIEYTNDIKFEINIEKPDTPFIIEDEYDLLIIAHTPYASLLTPLVEHKNSHNIETKLVTLDDISEETFFPLEGRDIQEQIKYFIKNAIENWGVTYVMLVGNYKKIPIRYSHLETDTGGTYEELEYITDLYYSDIYDSGGNFSSWDTDGDGIIGEWPYPEPHPIEDERDLYPDIYIGRLACMWKFEVRAMVDKIITYEENTYGQDWFNNMILCGGDTFDKSWEEGTDYNEGEEANAKAIEYMEKFNHVKLWATLDNLYTDTISDAINQGAGFLYMVGHGNPRNWATHKNGDYQNWTEGLFNKDILKLKSKDKYTILMVGGCHNSEFDVTPLNLLKNFTRAWIWSTWVPECWSWVFVKNPNGGAIASIGSSGYGGVNIGDYNENDIPDCVEGLDGWFETQFFRLYNEEGIDMLGETYGQTISDYVDTFPVFDYRYDCKIVETHVLMGDPTLKIGGYEN